MTKADNWDTRTADTCTLPKYIKDACLRCRDYKYCYRQTALDLSEEGDEE